MDEKEQFLKRISEDSIPQEDIILTTSEGFTFRPRCIRFENQNKLSKGELEEFKRGLEKILCVN